MSCEQCGAPTDRDRQQCPDCATDGESVEVQAAAALAGLGGLVTAVLGLGLFAAGTLLAFLAPFVVGLGLAQVAVARGLWNGEYWAWGWGVTLYALNAVLALGGAVLTTGTEGAVAAAVVAGLVAAYIYGRHPQFAAGDGPTAASRAP